MRPVALIGFVALASAIASYYLTNEFGWFGRANAVLALVALTAAAGAGARHLRRLGGAASHRVVGRGLLIVVGAVAAAVALERLAATSKLEFDWTFERAFELAPATLKALRELPGEATATLYREAGDPRIRRTRLLLGRLAEQGNLTVRERDLAEHPEDADRFEVGSSNTVVIVLGDRFETVERPTEGSLYEALSRLQSAEGGSITVLRGEGEGDLSRTDETGYAGLAAALATEGYELQSVVSASMEEVPASTDVVLVVGARRPLRAPALAALGRYLDGGGSLVALLEPDAETGLEALLAKWGIESPEGVVIDPERDAASAPPSGLQPVAYHYWDHPIAQGLDRNRMTYFSGARSFQLRKPRPEDELSKVVETTRFAWIDPDLSALDRRSGEFERDGHRADYWPLVVSGRYPRSGRETRIVAFGDADFASNQNLRTLYNLDLLLNAVHWAAENEPEITLRPKIRPPPVQFPVPLTNTLQTLYGVGLLVPELLLIVSGLLWLRRRHS